MNGRLEKELKIEKEIQKKLSTTPIYVSEWIHYLNAIGKQPTTRRDFLCKIILFLKSINSNYLEVQIEDFNEKVLEDYFISIKTRKVNNQAQYTSYSYRQNTYTCLNNFFTYLYNSNKIPKNYMDKIDKPKGNDLQRINNHRVLLSSDDFNRIVKHITNEIDNHLYNDFIKRDLLMFLIFMTTGMRESALQSINIDDIDYSINTLTVYDKNDIEHKYYLNDTVMNALYDWLDAREHNLYDENIKALFISTAGIRMHVNSIAKIIRKYSKKALGYEISPHKLRSGLCSILYEQWGDIEKVRRAIGHSNITTTQRYIVTNNEERKDAANILQNLL